MRVRWTGTALADVGAIEAYVTTTNPMAARRLAAELIVAGDSLTTFPELGRPGLEPATRELVALRPYLLVYRILDGA